MVSLLPHLYRAVALSILVVHKLQPAVNCLINALMWIHFIRLFTYFICLNIYLVFCNTNRDRMSANQEVYTHNLKSAKTL